MQATEYASAGKAGGPSGSHQLQPWSPPGAWTLEVAPLSFVSERGTLSIGGDSCEYHYP